MSSRNIITASNGTDSSTTTNSSITNTNNNSNSSNNNTIGTSSNSTCSRTSSNSSSNIVSVTIERVGSKCPFGNNEPITFTITNGGCIWIQGSSGRGKTTIAMSIAGLSSTCSTSKQINTNTNSSTSTNSSNSNSNSCIEQIQHNHLDINISMIWNNNIPYNERCGVVFQQTTLLDELTVGGNIYIAIMQNQQQQQNDCSNNKNMNSDTTTTTSTTKQSMEQQIKYLVELVGLNYNTVINKHIHELSGGMSRRVLLAVQLANLKNIIILDEPFTGLDNDTAISIAKELYSIRQKQRRSTTSTRTSNTCPAFILITHQYDIAQYVLYNKCNNNTTDSNADDINHNNTIIKLEPPQSIHSINADDVTTTLKPLLSPQVLNLHGTRFIHRLCDRLVDYTVYSLPLIILTFIAIGFAISMLSADSLEKIDVTKYIMEIVNTEIPSLIKLITGETPSPFIMLGVRIKVTSVLQTIIPPSKMKLYTIGYTKLVLLEIGPLITGLLLTGRIGGSYSGMISTMYSSQQMLLLQTLHISKMYWTFYPALIAAVVSAPIISFIGTTIALYIGSIIVPIYNLGTTSTYWNIVYETIFPSIRYLSSVSVSTTNKTTITTTTTTTTNSSMYDKVIYYIIEFGTWPIIFHLLKSISFIIITIIVAEICCYCSMNNIFTFLIRTSNTTTTTTTTTASRKQQLTTRNVPYVITSTVVTSGLCIIILDWGFSQFWLLRQ